MTKHGKKFTDATRRFDRERLYPATEALDLVKSLATRKFDETVEAAFRLGVDPRKADQMIRGTVSLPKGTGKNVRVAVFAEGDSAREAEEAGADVVGSDDLVAQIEKGFLDFDVAIATPDMMPKVGKLGRTLGPRNLMPNPKAGTVSNEVGKTVGEFKAGKVEYRTDRYGNVHVPIGKASFESEDLLATTRPSSTRCSGRSRRRRRAGTSGPSRCRRAWARVSTSTPRSCVTSSPSRR